MTKQWSKVTAMVTGGAGFIGSNLVRRLLELGARVVVVDNFSSGRRRNLDFIEREDYAGRFELVEADIRDYPVLKDAVRGCEYAFHLAAMASVPASVENPFEANEINVGGSINLLRAGRDAGVRRVIFSSSSAVYGDDPRLPKEESMLPRPQSPYASSKLAMEHYAANYTTLFGFETVLLRYFNVFGPQQDPKSMYAAVIPIFVYKLLKGERPTIFGDGEQTRDFVHVNDVLRANLLAATASTDALGAAINIAGGRRISVNLLFRTIRKLLGSPLEALHAAERPGDVRHSVASIAKAGEVLGFSPEISVEDGLARSIEWYREDFERSGGLQ